MYIPSIPKPYDFMMENDDGKAQSPEATGLCFLVQFLLSTWSRPFSSSRAVKT